MRLFVYRGYIHLRKKEKLGKSGIPDYSNVMF